MIEPDPVQQTDRVWVNHRDRKLLYFSGCDYFRMASHPRVLAAFHRGAKEFGLNVAASRLTTGNHAIYGRLEAALAKFFGAPGALLIPTGYLADLIAAQALAGTFSHALLDEAAHPALQDAAGLLRARVRLFKSCDPRSLAQAARRCGAGARILVLTDGMFARDGSVAPLAEYLKSCLRRRTSWWMMRMGQGCSVPLARAPLSTPGYPGNALSRRSLSAKPSAFMAGPSLGRRPCANRRSAAAGSSSAARPCLRRSPLPLLPALDCTPPETRCGSGCATTPGI